MASSFTLPFFTTTKPDTIKRRAAFTTAASKKLNNSIYKLQNYLPFNRSKPKLISSSISSTTTSDDSYYSTTSSFQSHSYHDKPDPHPLPTDRIKEHVRTLSMSDDSIQLHGNVSSSLYANESTSGIFFSSPDLTATTSLRRNSISLAAPLPPTLPNNSTTEWGDFASWLHNKVHHLSDLTTPTSPLHRTNSQSLPYPRPKPSRNRHSRFPNWLGHVLPTKSKSSSSSKLPSPPPELCMVCSTKCPPVPLPNCDEIEGGGHLYVQMVEIDSLM